MVFESVASRVQGEAMTVAVMVMVPSAALLTDENNRQALNISNAAFEIFINKTLC